MLLPPLFELVSDFSISLLYLLGDLNLEELLLAAAA